MKTICITDNRSECNNYCPMCGVNNINAKGAVKECKHLVLIATSETIDNPEFDKENLISKLDYEKYENITEYFDKILNDDYSMFLLSQDAPAALEAYIIYKLSEN